MLYILDTARSCWADAAHTVIYAYIKTSEGWERRDCTQYSTGIEREIWDARDELELQPAEDEMTDEALIKHVQAAVQARLDAVAAQRLYDDGKSLMTYILSTCPRFRAEAEAFNRWRDQCWEIVTRIKEAVESGEIPRPTFDDIMAQVPTFSWAEVEYPQDNT